MLLHDLGDSSVQLWSQRQHLTSREATSLPMPRLMIAKIRHIIIDPHMTTRCLMLKPLLQPSRPHQDWPRRSTNTRPFVVAPPPFPHHHRTRRQSIPFSLLIPSLIKISLRFFNHFRPHLIQHSSRTLQLIRSNVQPPRELLQSLDIYFEFDHRYNFIDKENAPSCCS